MTERYKEMLDAPSLKEYVYINVTRYGFEEVYLRMGPIGPELRYLGPLKRESWGEYEVNGSHGKSRLGAIRGAIGRLMNDSTRAN